MKKLGKLREIEGPSAARALNAIHYLSKEIHFNPKDFGYKAGESCCPSMKIDETCRLHDLRERISGRHDPVGWALDVAHADGTSSKTRVAWECVELTLNARFNLAMALPEPDRIESLLKEWLPLLPAVHAPKLARMKNSHAESILVGKHVVVLFEMKVRGCSTQSFSADQHLNYLRMVWKIATDLRPAPDVFLILLEPEGTHCYEQKSWLELPDSRGMVPKPEFEKLKQAATEKWRKRLSKDDMRDGIQGAIERTTTIVTSYETLFDTAPRVFSDNVLEEALALKNLGLIRAEAAPRMPTSPSAGAIQTRIDLP